MYLALSPPGKTEGTELVPPFTANSVEAQLDPPSPDHSKRTPSNIVAVHKTCSDYGVCERGSFSAKIVTKTGETAHLIRCVDGLEAVLQDRRYPGAPSLVLPVRFGSGATPVLLLNRGASARACHAEIITTKGAGCFDMAKVLFIGKTGLVGGGGLSSKEAPCSCVLPVYVCRQCSFRCPENHCSVCCSHKFHPCRERQLQKQQEREKESKAAEAAIVAEIQRQVTSCERIQFDNDSEDEDTEWCATTEEIRKSYTTECFVSGVLETDLKDTDNSEALENAGANASSGPVVPFSAVCPRFVCLPPPSSNDNIQGSSRDSRPGSRDFLLTNPVGAFGNLLSRFGFGHFDNFRSLSRPENFLAFFNNNDAFSKRKDATAPQPNNRRTGQQAFEQTEDMLLKEFLSSSNANCISVEKFRVMWRKMMEERDISERVQVLRVIQQVILLHSVKSLSAVLSILHWVTNNGLKDQCVLTCSDRAWIELKELWLMERLRKLIHLSQEEQGLLSTALAQTNWGMELTEIFLTAVSDEVVDKMLDFISCACKAPESLVLFTLMSRFCLDTEGSKIPKWTSDLSFQILCNKINQQAPGIGNSIALTVYGFLQMKFCPDIIFEAMSKNIASIQQNVDQFVEVLKLLFLYQVDEETYRKALSSIHGVSAKHWIATVDRLIVEETFQESRMYKVNELIQMIIKNSGDFMHEDLLKSHHEKVRKSLREPSELSIDTADWSSYGKIISWHEAEVKEWAKFVKGDEKVPRVSVFEEVAVITHAVKLHFKLTPRDTQILTLLVLLHPKTDTGRLVQVNTGEGKSLVVAMFAAILALRGFKVDVVTTSTELSIRETRKLSGFFKMLSLTVAENSDDEMKEDAYKSDVLYGTAADFQADILRKEFLGDDRRAGRQHDVIIVDEVDSMLFDNRTFSVRLSTLVPGTDHLEIILGAVWERIHRINRHLVKEDGKMYFIREDFIKQPGAVILESGAKWRKELSEPVEDVRSFIIEKAEEQLRNMLRDLDDDNDNDNDNHVYRPCEEIELEICYPEDEQPCLRTPCHLREFARCQLPFWIRNAVDAKWTYKRDAHYTVKDNKIVPIHFNENGILQPNLVWSDGLTQFLQIKEGLPIDPEGITTNFISNVSFFHRYGCHIYGLTGTLGEDATQEFLFKVYKTDMVVVPPYKHRTVKNNGSSSYLCKELTPVVVSGEAEWYKNIETNALFHARIGRSVLIICKYICQVRDLEQKLKSQDSSRKIYTYTGEEDFDKEEVTCGDIIISTNIAGRGTDLKTSREVEKNGGMYVAITFLPQSLRVELQNVGRTAREGKKGMAQLIIRNASLLDVESLKKLRHEQEVRATLRATDDAERMLLQDRLFSRFCAVESKYLPSLPTCEKMEIWNKLYTRWERYCSEKLSPQIVKKMFHQHTRNCRERVLSSLRGSSLWLSHFVKNGRQDHSSLPGNTSKQENCREPILLHESAEEQIEQGFPEFFENYKQRALDHFCETSAEAVPADLLQCLREGKQFVPESSDLAQDFKWGCHERLALEERWGLWLKSKHFEMEDIDMNRAISLFKDEFEVPMQDWAKEDELIQDPYHFVSKGNGFLNEALAQNARWYEIWLWKSKRTVKENKLHDAILCYDRALELDPKFPVSARYNKACALLLFDNVTPERRTHARKELEGAKSMVTDVLLPSVLQLFMFLSQSHMLRGTIQHIQHQVDVLLQEFCYMDQACEAILHFKDSATLQVHRLTVKEAFDLSDDDHSKAIREVIANGLTHFFVLGENKPPPVKDLITAVSTILLGVVKVVAAVAEFEYSKNTRVNISCLYHLLPVGVIGVCEIVYGLKRALQSALPIMREGWQRGTACRQGLSEGPVDIETPIKSLLERQNFQRYLALATDLNVITNKHKTFETHAHSLIKSLVRGKLSKNSLVEKSLSVDKSKRSKYWQQLFFKKIAKLQNSDCNLQQCERQLQESFQNISESSEKNEFNQEVTNYVEMLMEKFIADVNKVEKLIRKEFDEQQWIGKRAARSTFQYVANLVSWTTPVVAELPAESRTGVSQASPADEEDDIDVVSVDAAGRYSSKVGHRGIQLPWLAPNSKPLSMESFIDVFANKVFLQLSDGVHTYATQQVAMAENAEGNQNIRENLFREVDETYSEFRDKVRRNKGLQDTDTNPDEIVEQGNVECREKLFEEDRNTNNPQDEQQAELSDSVRKVVSFLEEDIPTDLATMKILASVLRCPVVVFEAETEKLIHVAERQLPGKPIMLRTMKQPMGYRCYYEPLDGSLEVEGNNQSTSFMDVVWAQVDLEGRRRVNDLAGLRQLMIKTIQNNPEQVNKLYETQEMLHRLVPLCRCMKRSFVLERVTQFGKKVKGMFSFVKRNV